jgi:hypothetical protein
MHRQLSLTLALVTAGEVGAATRASAQEKPAPPAATAAGPDSAMWSMNPAERLLARKADLTLTDEQVKKLEELKTEFAGKTASGDTGRAAWRARRDQMREATAVLTDAQREKLHAMRSERHAAWKAKHDSLHRSHQGGTAADSAKP